MTIHVAVCGPDPCSEEVARQAEERLGPPFLDGERVTPEPQSSDAVDFGPSGTAMVIHQNRPDWSHDYDWCLVRLDDGQEIELPAFILRRLGEGS